MHKAIVQNQPILSEAGVEYNDGVYEFDARWSKDEAKGWMKRNGIRWIRFDVNNKDMEKETRLLNTEFRVETREDKTVVVGEAAVFNSLSEDLGGFREKIAPNAFDGVLNDDVRVLKNHNGDWILGRTRANTARIGTSDRALTYDYDDPQTSYSKDLLISMNRGDITQSSFAFRIGDGGDSWEKDENGNLIRTIMKVERLYDVSPVTYPAYPDTTVAKRSLEALKQEELQDRTAKDRIEQERIEREKILRELELS